MALIKVNSGKRKCRRYFNTKFVCRNVKINLDHVKSEADLLNDELSNDVMETYKGPFERLMDITDDTLSLLNEFCEQNSHTIEQDYTKMRSTQPYLRISNKIRRSMKVRKNFPSKRYKELEHQIIDYFLEHPDVLNLVPCTSFERLFVHGLAQYHNLQATSKYLQLNYINHNK